MTKIRNVPAGVALITFTVAGTASAHFKLTNPPSWLKEDPAVVGGGGPQKGSPCGPGGIDDVKPIPTSGIVTDFHVGQTIELDWVDTIAHPGYFRIALAQDRTQLKDPTITQDASCNFDESMVPKGASGNVLADGVLFRSRNGFNAPSGTKFTYMVTLPSTPCDKCTLQVMQVMETDIQSLSNCHYFHCADIRILAAGQGSGTGGSSGAGSGGTSGSAGSAGTAGLPVMGMGGFVTGGSTGSATGFAGMLGLGGGTTSTAGTTGSGATGTITMGTAGSVTMTPGTTGGGGAASGTPAPGSGGALGATGTGGVATNAASSSESSSCAVALRSHTTASALSGAFALLALVGLGRRRRAAGAPRR